MCSHDEHEHDAGEGEQEAGAHRVDAPGFEHAGQGLHHRDLPIGILQVAHRGNGLDAGGQGDARRAGLLGEGDDQPSIAEKIPQGLGHRLCGRGRDDAARGIADEDAAAMLEDALRIGGLDLRRGLALARLAAARVEIGCERDGDHLHLAHRILDGALAIAVDRNADDGRQEQADHDRNGKTQDHLHARMYGRVHGRNGA